MAFSPHGAPLWFAVRFSVLWPDDPSMQDARGTPFNHLGHTTQSLCGQSVLATGQDSERFLVAFYDKLIAAVGLFFSLTPGTRTGLPRWLNGVPLASCMLGSSGHNTENLTAKHSGAPYWGKIPRSTHFKDLFCSRSFDSATGG